MGKKLDRLVARIEALEKAIAAMLTGKKPKNSARKKTRKPAAKKKAPAKKPMTKKVRRSGKKAKPAPMVLPAPLAATL